MHEPNVQWLFDQMRNATNVGALLTIQTIIKLEFESKEAYTKDAELMQQLRDCWKNQNARLAEEAISQEKYGEARDDSKERFSV
jgi:hypothetical protein